MSALRLGGAVCGALFVVLLQTSDVGAQYKVANGVVCAGGGNLASVSYGSRGTAGETAIGVGESESYSSGGGFWYSPGTTVTGAGDDLPELPRVFSLDQNYPNPFNPTTTIRFALPKASWVRLSVYDVSGALVATLIDREIGPGVHTTEWDAGALATGVYLYRIQADAFVQTRKLVLLK